MATTMDTLSHKAQRAAFGVALDMALKHIEKDDAKFFQNIVKYLNQQGKRLTVPQCGSTYSLGSAQFQFLGPVRPSDDPNNMSLVLRITYGDTSFLFTGDAERDEEADILKAGYPLKSTVLKPPLPIRFCALLRRNTALFPAVQAIPTAIPTMQLYPACAMQT